MSVEYHIIKNGQVLDKRTFFSDDMISAYVKQGFTISKITTQGKKTIIETHSPLTYAESVEKSKGAMANVLSKIKKVV